MPDTFLPLSEVVWVEQLVCDRYKIKVPKFLTDTHNWWGDWEKERFASMEQNLREGDVLFDIGAETGWQSAIYAQFVGAKNMCLFEPVPEVWPSIKAHWEANELPMPMVSSCTLVGDKNTVLFPNPVFHVNSWPDASRGGMMLENVKYRHIDEHGSFTPQITLDKFVFDSLGIRPNAITIDVEGAELLTLRGAEQVLREIRPYVWVSLHEGLTRPGVEPKNQDVIAYMASLGYSGTFLGHDHEAHWLFV